MSNFLSRADSGSSSDSEDKERREQEQEQDEKEEQELKVAAAKEPAPRISDALAALGVYARSMKPDKTWLSESTPLLPPSLFPVCDP